MPRWPSGSRIFENGKYWLQAIISHITNPIYNHSSISGMTNISQEIVEYTTIEIYRPLSISTVNMYLASLCAGSDQGPSNASGFYTFLEPLTSRVRRCRKYILLLVANIC